MPANEPADIPIFNVLETILQKIIPPQPVKNEAEPSVASTSKTPEPVIDEPETSRLSESIEPINEVVNLPPREIPTDSPKPNSNELLSAILLARAQREERLRKKAVELGENPDVFMTITKKDRFDSTTFRDRMETNSRMCGYAKEMEKDPKEHMDMTVRERLIGEEIIRRSFEKDGIISS